MIGIHDIRSTGKPAHLIARFLIEKKGKKPHGALDTVNTTRGKPISEKKYSKRSFGIFSSLGNRDTPVLYCCRL